MKLSRKSRKIGNFKMQNNEILWRRERKKCNGRKIVIYRWHWFESNYRLIMKQKRKRIGISEHRAKSLVTMELFEWIKKISLLPLKIFIQRRKMAESRLGSACKRAKWDSDEWVEHSWSLIRRFFDSKILMQQKWASLFSLLQMSNSILFSRKAKNSLKIVHWNWTAAT